MAIIIITDKLNRGGFRVNVAGIQLDNYKKNPVLLFMHSRAYDEWNKRTKEDERLPVGRLENLRVEGGQLVADDPIWDDKDEFALVLKSKFEGGFMSAFSAGLRPLTVSDDPSWLEKGQSRSTLVTSELLEVSFVDIGKDGNAVRLSLDECLTLDDAVPTIRQQPNSIMDLKKIALKLGLKSDVTEDEVLAAISVNATELEGHRKSRTASLLALGRQKGVVNDTNAAQWERTINLDFDNAEQLIGNFAPIADAADKPPTAQELLKLSQQQNQGAQAKDVEDRSKWSFLQWSKEDPNGLNKLRLEDPAKYEALALKYKPETA